MNGSVRRSVLLSPVVACLPVLLIVNDRIVKPRWPGVVSGKVSDVVGLALLAAVVVALIEATRRAALPIAGGVVVAVGVAVAFAIVKTTEWGRHAFEQSNAWVLSQVHKVIPWVGRRPVSIVRDPTDLVAIPAAFLVVAIMARRHDLD